MDVTVPKPTLDNFAEFRHQKEVEQFCHQEDVCHWDLYYGNILYYINDLFEDKGWEKTQHISEAKMTLAEVHDW